MKTSLGRSRNTHKGDYGHALVLAGSRGLTGAAVMTAQAAVRSGAGRVTLGTPRSVYPIVARRLVEVMTLPLKETARGSLAFSALDDILRFARKADAAAVGPGLSTRPSTRRLVAALVKRLACPLVLDADGINCLQGQAALLRKAKKRPVITPHDGEYRRLFGKKPPRALSERKEVAKKIASHYDCIVVLKGSRTVVSAPGGRVYVNHTGNPGMATGGTGDVLTGMIAAFLAQGLEPFLAASLAVYAHGKAGDAAARKKGETSLIATDLLDCLPGVLKKLEKGRDLKRFIS